MSDSAHDLLVRGIAAAKANDKNEARFYLEWTLRNDPTIEQCIDAWLWLSEISDDPAEQRDLLEKILAENMAHPEARRKLAVLDGRLKPGEIVDPDRLPSPATHALQPASGRAQRFVCPTCGGRMTFTPDGKSLACEFCDRRQVLAQPCQGGAAPQEQDFIVALATAKGHLPPVATRSFKCRGCGAAFMLAPETLSLTCPYCESVYVIDLAESREVIPATGLIPFAISQVQAHDALQRWLKEHVNAVSHNTPVVPRGLYLPVWTFDINLEVRWQFSRNDGRGWVTDSGSEPAFYDDVLVPARRALPAPVAEELHHFHLDRLARYDPRYLADWPAEIYTIPVADASLEARARALESARSSIAAGLDTPVRDLSVNAADMFVTSFKLVLLPVWLARYSAEDKPRHVVVNGQTGTVRGEQPGGARRVLNWLLGED